MTKPINIKKLKKEITKIISHYGICSKGAGLIYEEVRAVSSLLPEDELAMNIYGLLHEFIKQIVESVPLEEKDEFDVGLSARDTIMNAYSKGKEAGKPIGYNQKTKEIKQWKKKILEEIR